VTSRVFSWVYLTYFQKPWLSGFSVTGRHPGNVKYWYKMKKLKFFQMWDKTLLLSTTAYFYHRMSRIYFMGAKSKHHEGFQPNQKRCGVLRVFTIKRRKPQFLKIMHGEIYKLLREIIEGSIAVRQSIEKRQNCRLKDLWQWLNDSSPDIFWNAVFRNPDFFVNIYIALV